MRPMTSLQILPSPRGRGRDPSRQAWEGEGVRTLLSVAGRRRSNILMHLTPSPSRCAGPSLSPWEREAVGQPAGRKVA